MRAGEPRPKGGGSGLWRQGSAYRWLHFLYVPLGAKALMRPSPKLPTSTPLLSVPKLAGARARPQGELSVPREAMRCIRFPFVSKTSTNPFPAALTSSWWDSFCRAKLTQSFAANVLDPEGGEALTSKWTVACQRRVTEGLDLSETGVEHLNGSEAEIGGKQEVAGAVLSHGKPFVPSPLAGGCDPKGRSGSS